MAELEHVDGQAEAEPTGTTAEAPANMGEQSVTDGQTTNTGPGAEATFFDPETIKDKPELMAAYKQMQSAFTKKSQSYAQEKHKIEAYNAFERDPMGTLKQMAQQYGYQLMQPDQNQEGDWEPKTWDEVMKRAEDQAYNRLKSEMEPVIGKVQSLQKQSMESYMDANYSDWRTYEDGMIDILGKHPTLANDLDRLYDLALPREVRDSRAYQKALKKVTQQSGASEVSGGSTTTKQPSTKPSGPLSFDDAVALAKSQLSEKGIRPH